MTKHVAHRITAPLHRFVGIALASSLCLAGIAHGASMDLFGLSPATAGQGRANSADPEAAYAAVANPGTLSLPGEAAALNVVHVNWQLKNLAAGHKTGGPLTPDNFRADRAAPYSALSFGYKKSLPLNLGLGVAGLIPDGFMAVHGDSGQELGYLDYNLRQKRPEVMVAAGANPFAGLTVGLGSMLTVAMTAEMQAGLSNETSAGRLNLETKPAAIPFYSISYQHDAAATKLSASYTVRQSHRSDAEVQTQFVAQTDSFSLPTEIASQLTAFYDPEVRTTSLAVSQGRWQIGLSHVRTIWSDFNPGVITLSGPDIALLTADQEARRTPNLSDANTWRLGGAFAVGQDGAYVLRAGYENHRRVRFSGNKDYLVDNDRHIYSVGMGLPLAGNTFPQLRANISYQYARLVAQEVVNSEGTAVTAGGRAQIFMGGLSRAF